MEEMKAFIAQAREKGLDDETIRQSLEAKGWEKASVNMALVGMEAPSAPAAATPAETTAIRPVETATDSTAKPSLSHLLSALLHVILWFFTASSTVTIGGAVASLYGFEVSANALASMIAVTLITFVPYAVLYAIFLRKNGKLAGVVPGKVWSIITICLHSIGAMIAAIIVAVTIITKGEQSVLVSAGLVLLLDLIVVLTYAMAAFAFKLRKTRTIFLALHLPILIIMFGILFALCTMHLGPAKHDEDLRKDLSTTVHNIAGRTREQNKLPDSINGLTTNSSITYEKTSDTKYHVCADFQATNNSTARYDYGYMSNEQTDDYVSESQFYTTRSGNHCFDFTSSYLTAPKNGGVEQPLSQ